HHPRPRGQVILRRRKAVHQPGHRHGRHRQGQARRCQGNLLQERDHRHHHGPWHPSEHPEVRRLKVASLSRGIPFLCACADQKFLPPSIPLGTKFSGEPCTRPDGPRTLSPENFPVCVPAVGACPPAGTDLKERVKPISEIFLENRLTKPHLCGKIFMLFLRQQALESCVKCIRLPSKASRCFMSLSRPVCAGERLFLWLRLPM